MASANPKIVQPTGEGMDPELTLQDMQRLQARFAEEAINFLLVNAQLWDETLDLTPIVNSTETVVFTLEVGKAINTIAYIQRIGYRKKFRLIGPHITNVKSFDQYVMNFPIRKTSTYFYNFLGWVAYTFDFMVYYLKRGKDLIDEGRDCLAKYPDLEYFHSQGGWKRLLECSSFLTELHDKLSSVISKEQPTDDVFLPFMTAVELMEKEERSSGCKSKLLTPDMRRLREVRRRLNFKYDVISCVDSRRVMTGFKVRMKNSPIKPKSLEEICPKAAEMLEKLGSNFKNTKAEVDDFVETVEKTRIAVELTDRSPESEGEAADSVPSEVYQSKCVFIVNDRFLKRRESRVESKRSKKRSGRKVYSPNRRIVKLVTNLNDVLDENIANKNYTQMTEDIYSICPPGCDIGDDATRLIVLETSSEEEDDDYVTLKQIEEVIIKIMTKCKDRQNQNVGANLGQSTNGDPSGYTVSSQIPEQELHPPPGFTRIIPKFKQSDPLKETETDKDLPKKSQATPSDVSDSNNPDQNPTQESVKEVLLIKEEIE